MNNNSYREDFVPKNLIFKHIFRIMKLYCLFTLIFISGMFASELKSQNSKVSIHANRMPILQLIKEIESQTDYLFVYSKDDIDIHKEVNVATSNKTVASVLKETLEKTDIVYAMEGTNIMLMKRPSATAGIQQTEKPIKGIVVDEQGEPMIGVNVKLVGGSTGTITGLNGEYSLVVPLGAKLQFSYIGYTIKEIKAESTVVHVKMDPITESLDEVVVIGYGTVKKRDLTGSVTSLKKEDITAVPVSNLVESLQGKIPGLDMTKESGQAGSALSFTLRGNRSLNASNGPLILVDGITYGTTVDINPSDVESIEVLKDASSTAIYGTRGANGVILITTKKGKSGKPKVYANIYAGMQTIGANADIMTGEEFVKFRKEAYRTNGVVDETAIFSANDLSYINAGKFVDWQKECLKNGSLQNYEVGVTGGNDVSVYNFSLGMYDEKGLFKNDNLRRYNAKLGVETVLLDNLKVGANVVYTYKDGNQRQDPLNMANKMYPWGDLYNEDGSIKIYPANNSNLSPLVDEIENNYINNTLSKRFFGSAYLHWEMIKDLTFRSTFGADMQDYRQGKYYGKYAINGGGKNSHSEITNTAVQNYTFENTLNYTKTWGIHSFDAMGGFSLMENRSELHNSSGEAQVSELNGFSDLGSNTLNLQIASNYEKSNLASFFGRVNYRLMDKYLLTASLRADGSSVLAKGNKWGYFPSVALAWRINEEGFLKQFDKLSNLKLRASWGIAGNSAISPYATMGGLSSSVYSFGDVLASGYYLSKIKNPNLSWEKTMTYNLAVDFGFFQNRLSGSVELYLSNTSDLLMQKSIPVTSGFTTVWENVGETGNKGIEISLSSVNVESKTPAGFSWKTDVTFFANKEEIKALASGENRDLVNYWFVGEPTSVFYDYQKVGIWQLSEEAAAAEYGQKPGDIKVADVDGVKGISDADRVIVGSVRPKWTASMNNHFSYKNFDLSVFLYARYGQTIESEADGNYKINAIENTARVDYWTPENPTNSHPRPDNNKNANSLYMSTLYYKDGSFLKIRDITLGYTIPRNVLHHTPFSSVRIYSTLKNFFTFSHLGNYDPERGGSMSFPMMRQATFGINVTL